tara:strand:- start:292 stop:684 length:393 start_codon:yes stop_codon:yes gene_type:complete
MKKDLNYIAALEKAIAKKYGDLAIQNPAKFWSEEKEQQYIEQLQEFVKKQQKYEHETRPENVDGVLITRKLIKEGTKLNCPVCSKKIKTINDDVYMIKYECCELCYVKYVEANLERWLNGWRPKNVTKSG